MTAPLLTSERLNDLQRESFAYFVNETNPANGLVADRTKAGTPASIAAVGLGLASYPVGVERGLLSREDAAVRTLATLRFFRDAPQGKSPTATGYKGFYYHFLDMQTGDRFGKCELSTIDSTYVIAGMLAAAAYFTAESRSEQEIRSLADELYRRVDWQWALDGGATVTHGWKPESGFLPDRWEGYSEALLLYLLGLGSPTHPLSDDSYAAWTSTYEWRNIYDHEYLYSGPLFTHQLSHVWVDFRGIADWYMRGKCIDYFENSRRATYAQQQYAIHNPASSKATARTVGELRPATVPAGNRAKSTAQTRISFSTQHGAYPTVPTTERSLHGRRLPPYRSPLRSYSRPFSTLTI